MTPSEAREIKRLYNEGKDIDEIISLLVDGKYKDLCKICGKSFTKVGNSLCCSDKCRLENKKQNRRRSWHRVGKHTDDKYNRHLKQRLRRIRERHERHRPDTN